MKKVLLSFLLLIAILVNHEMIFALDRAEYNKEEIEFAKGKVEELFSERSKLWNQLFVEEEKLNDQLNELEKYVTEPLLSYDIKTFIDIKKDCTNMDRINNITVKSIKNLDLKDDKMELDAEIHWEMENLESIYDEILNYHIYLTKNNEQWKISDYSIN